MSTVCVPRYGYETILQHVHRRSLNKWQVRFCPCITRAYTWVWQVHVTPVSQSPKHTTYFKSYYL